MRWRRERLSEPVIEESNVLVLALLTLVAGAASGLIAAAFRLALERDDHWRDMLINLGHDQPLVGFVLVVAGCAAAVALAASLSRVSSRK